MMRRDRRRSSGLEALPEITLTPLIDTALVLLVIFMVATPVMHNSIKLDLPKGQMQEGKAIPQEIIVHVDRSENMYLNGDPVKKDNLILELEKRIGDKKDVTVYVNGDSHTPYRAVAETVDRIKYTTGVEHVVLGLEKA